jgi:hypothetical protein
MLVAAHDAGGGSLHDCVCELGCHFDFFRLAGWLRSFGGMSLSRNSETVAGNGGSGGNALGGGLSGLSGSGVRRCGQIGRGGQSAPMNDRKCGEGRRRGCTFSSWRYLKSGRSPIVDHLPGSLSMSGWIRVQDTCVPDLVTM